MDDIWVGFCGTGPTAGPASPSDQIQTRVARNQELDLPATRNLRLRSAATAARVCEAHGSSARIARSGTTVDAVLRGFEHAQLFAAGRPVHVASTRARRRVAAQPVRRSEEHTSELQSR